LLILSPVDFECFLTKFPKIKVLLPTYILFIKRHNILNFLMLCNASDGYYKIDKMIRL
jgi:hypothetical protein